MDTTAETVVCPRHPRREAEPALCTDCVDQARTAIWRLPEQHRLLLGVRHATRTRLERRSNGGAPPSISPWYDHADDIERTMRNWANGWAELTGRPQHPTGDPAWSARTLLDQRHGNPLHHQDAPALAAEMLRLHRTAARLLRDEDERPVTRRRVAGPCPGCERATLHRTADSDRIRCDNCPTSLSEDDYREYAQALAVAHQGAA